MRGETCFSTEYAGGVPHFAFGVRGEKRAQPFGPSVFFTRARGFIHNKWLNG